MAPGSGTGFTAMLSIGNSLDIVKNSRRRHSRGWVVSLHPLMRWNMVPYHLCVQSLRPMVLMMPVLVACSILTIFYQGKQSKQLCLVAG